MKRKVVSLVLVFAMLCPLFAVGVSAVGSPNVPAVSGELKNVVSVPSGYNTLFEAAEFISSIVSDEAKEYVTDLLTFLASVTQYGEMEYYQLVSRMESIRLLMTDVNQLIKANKANPSLGLRAMPDSALQAFVAAFYSANITFAIESWQGAGDERLVIMAYISGQKYIVANSVGQYPYAFENTDRFVDKEYASDDNPGQVLSEDAFYNKKADADFADQFADYVISIGKWTKYDSVTNSYQTFNVITGRLTSYPSVEFWLCNKNGNPYIMFTEKTVTGTDRDYYVDAEGGLVVDGDTVNVTQTDNNFALNMFPDGQLTFIDTLLYDPGSKTYTVTTYNTTNVENNTYNTYLSVYQYHIDYTSVTYIGATEEYTEEYKYYYELPDGRSSADLTAAELEALNTYIDVLPYIRSADDTSIRALYHFDGDTLDSSYWSHVGNFGWDKGASITYLEANAFNGCLYLDETEHQFHVQLPSNIGSKDFTMQFRYYQSYTAAPQLDSYVSIGGTKLIQFNGASLLNGSGTVLNAISIGNWQEICLQRIDGTLSIFLNGVPVGTVSLPNVFGKSVSFVFGSSQQTYKYFDEFRFVSEAVYPASGYTPSSVPFDTNLALVLPDSFVPVADEYWTFTSSKTNLLREYGLADWWGQLALESDHIKSIGSAPYWHKYSASGNVDYIAYSNLPSPVDSIFPNFTYNSVLTSLSAVDAVSFQTHNGNFSGAGSGTQSLSSYFVSPLYNVVGKPNYIGYVGNCGFATCLGYNISGVGSNYPLTLGGTYTFSVVTADGVVHSMTFTLPSSLEYAAYTNLSWLATSSFFSGYRIGLMDCGVSQYAGTSRVGRMLWLTVTADFDAAPPSQEFIYWELVEGNSTDLEAEFVQNVVAVADIDLNTPSLAARTDLEITGHQIGGVRPSLPEKGQVWALVESGRITSLQIYNGQAWVEVDGRIWTGQRWVPYYAYDVLLLKDMFDVVGSNPDKEYIYTESGFWTWLQGAWGQMMAKLEQIRVAIADGTGGGSGGDSSVLPDVPPTTPDGDDGWSFIDLVVTLADGTWTVVTRTVGLVFNGVTDIAGSVVHIGDLFDALDPESSTGIFVIPLE